MSDETNKLDIKETKQREKWKHHISLVFSLLGYTIGLGNIWRFPYLCMKNGGGAFLIPYFGCLFFIGMPLFFLEMSIGQFRSLGPIQIWKSIPLLQGLGWSSVVMCFIFALYYNTIIMWIVYYLLRSFTKTVPWLTCNNWWNTPQCFIRQSNTTHIGFNTTSPVYLNTTATRYNLDANATSFKPRSPAEEFWTNAVLQLSPGIEQQKGIQWELLGTLFISWAIVYICIVKGTKSLSKVLYFTVPFPYICLIILFIRGITLPGSFDGIKYYIVPDWKRLLEVQVWGDASIQVFYTLAPGYGGIIQMSSFAKFNNNCQRDSLIISLTCCLTSFAAGFSVFAILGFMAHDMGVAVKDVLTSGPGLVFITYPEAISRMPLPTLWAIVFFIMLLTVGLDSQFTSVETVLRSFYDLLPTRYRKRPALFTLVMCIFMFAVGTLFVTKAGMYNLQIVDWYAAVFSVWIVTILELVTMAYVYGVNRFYADIKLMIGSYPFMWWKIMWLGVTPLILTTMLFWSLFLMAPPSYGTYVYPVWAEVIGWMLALSGSVPIVVMAIIALCKANGTLVERLRFTLTPSEDWRPALAKDRESTIYELISKYDPNEKAYGHC